MLLARLIKVSCFWNVNCVIFLHLYKLSINMLFREIEKTEAKARIDDNKFAFFITIICSIFAVIALSSGVTLGRSAEFFTFTLITLGTIHFFILINIIFMSRVHLTFRTLSIAMIVFYILTLRTLI